MELIDFEGTKVATYTKGQQAGWPIVCIHGFCEDSRVWEDWITLLPDFQFIMIDMPGFGNSKIILNLTIEKIATIVKRVLDFYSVKKCFLVGHSMGGYVSLSFAKAFPEYIQGLCLFHSHPFADTPEKIDGRQKSISFIKTNGAVIFVRQLIPSLFAYHFNKGYQMEVNKMIHHAIQYTSEAIIAAQEAMIQRSEESEVLKQAAYPVLFIIGRQDKAVPIELSLAQIHLPKIADVRIYPTVGHMGMLEAPRETSKALSEFINNFS
jgi:pimeloyl-ACP methyl ester carboxylesterase